MSTVVVPLIALAVLRVGDVSCDSRPSPAVAGRASESVLLVRGRRGQDASPECVPEKRFPGPLHWCAQQLNLY
jgi:hypothetical protein